MDWTEIEWIIIRVTFQNRIMIIIGVIKVTVITEKDIVEWV